MQTESDAGRLHQLGMDTDKVYVSGNMKFDAGAAPANDSFAAELRWRFGLTDDTPLILAASTHANEEAIILKALKQGVSRSGPQPRLMIAPRHPERFSQVTDLLKESGLRWTRRTAPPTPSDQNSEVILLDSIGELRSAYALATIVFVGGSIAKTGGHNILEPAAIGVVVITGPHTHNFKQVVEEFVDAEAIIQLRSMSDSATIIELGDLFSELLADPGRRRDLGERARNLVTQNRGATVRTLDILSSILPASASRYEQVTSLSIQNARIP
jgi:3-deoxy-D-manno-octulosonic-acid transferase